MHGATWQSLPWRNQWRKSLVKEDKRLREEKRVHHEKEQFCDEIDRFVTVRQMWHVFYDEFKIVTNSSQKIFGDEFGMFRDESVLS
jgi:hypothetical protein